MHELWDASRSFAVWVYLGALLLPVLVGAGWWARQVRGGAGVDRELSRHELAYLKGGPREVVLAAVQRLVRTGVLSVSDRGLVNAAVPGRRRDRIDGVIVAHAEHVFPKAFLKPLRSALRGVARTLENDGLLVPRRAVVQRWKAVVLLQVGVFLVGVALFVVALALHEQPWLELLFAILAAVAVAVGIKESGRGTWVPTRGGTGTLTAAGVTRPRPRSGLRRAVALLTLFSLLTRTSVPQPIDENDPHHDFGADYPDAWTDGWSDSFTGGGDGSGDFGGGDGGGGDGGGGDGGGDGGGGM